MDGAHVSGASRSCWSRTRRRSERNLEALLPSLLSPSPSLPPTLAGLVSAKVQLSLAPLLLAYWRYADAERSLEGAQAACGLDVRVEGVMGRRTRWQREAKSQLVVRVVSRGEAEDEGKEQKDRGEGEEVREEKENEAYMPPVQAFESDVLLPSLALDDAGPSPPLSAIQRATLLAVVTQLQASAPASHTSTRQTLLAYLTLILQPQHARSWAVEQTALYQRALLELDDHHLMDRALGQLEDLTRGLRGGDGDAAVKRRVRMAHVYEAGWVSEWGVKLSVAGRFERLGLTRAALELYESVQWMEGIIDMNVALERRSVAETLIHSRLALQPTPKLLCLLGDLTRDPARYEEAWRLSAASYPRAQRSLSRHCRELLQWKEAMEHSRLALEGETRCRRWSGSRWDTARCRWGIGRGGCRGSVRWWRWTRSMRMGGTTSRHVTLHLQAWASALMALEPATRLHHDSWKVWENVLSAALHLSDYQRAMQAIERILQLKVHAKAVDKDAGDLVDVQAVERITAALLPYADPKAPDRWLGERWAAVLATLTDRVTTDPRLWRCVADWRQAEGQRAQAVQARERAYQAALLPVPASHPSTRARYSAYQLAEGGGARAVEVQGEVLVWTNSAWRLDEAMVMMEGLLRTYRDGGGETERMAGRMALEGMEGAVTRKASTAVKARWEERKADVERWKEWMGMGGTATAADAAGKSEQAADRTARSGGLHSSYADLWR